MIQLEKLEKPYILDKKEDDWTEEYKKWQNDEDVPDAAKNRYNQSEIKEKLIEETNGKCAYCESKIGGVSYEHIEHIKPKSKYHDLVVEWKNLTLSCQKCNNNKGKEYDEDCMPLNPYDDDPSNHLDAAGPMISVTSPRGQYTKNLLDLNRDKLLEERGDFLEDIDELVREIRSEDDYQECKALVSTLERHLKSDSRFTFAARRYVRYFLDLDSSPCSELAS